MALPSNQDTILLLHNPNCSKSRATVELLLARGVNFETRLYLDDPLAQDELIDLVGRLGKPALELARTKQVEFSDLGLDDSSSAEAILSVMAATPILMERPILVRGDRAAIGRPPEDVLALLDD